MIKPTKLYISFLFYGVKIQFVIELGRKKRDKIESDNTS